MRTPEEIQAKLKECEDKKTLFKLWNAPKQAIALIDEQISLLKWTLNDKEAKK
jgi:hypothetical protein